MFELVGIYDDVYQERIGERFESHISEGVVAIFSSRRLAEHYVRDSRLVRPRRGWCVEYPFRRSSLLSMAVGYEIREYHPEPDPPVDPVI